MPCAGLCPEELKKDEFDKPLNAALSHAWDHFSYHAAQRLNMFRYALVVFAFLLAGMGSLLGTANERLIVCLSIIGVLFVVCFWRIDVRNKQLVEVSEQALNRLHKILAEQAFENRADQVSMTFIKNSDSWEKVHAHLQLNQVPPDKAYEGKRGFIKLHPTRFSTLLPATYALCACVFAVLGFSAFFTESKINETDGVAIQEARLKA